MYTSWFLFIYSACHGKLTVLIWLWSLFAIYGNLCEANLYEYLLWYNNNVHMLACIIVWFFVITNFITNIQR